MKALVIDDDDLVRDNVAEVLRSDGWEVSEADSAERALEMAGDERWALVFCDVRLGGHGSPDGFAILRRFNEEQPGTKIVLMTGHGSAAGALDAVSLGAYDYLMKPFENREVLTISGAVRRNLEKKTRGSTSELTLPVYTSDIDLVGRSAAFVEVMKLVGRVAQTNLPVLITGESGTGKEVVARTIHHRSGRSSRPFVAVNCGAIPAELIESELFGHARGSFTGAVSDRRGLWQEADGGTIFLDEITETTSAFQVKLLRALQEGEIRRVGSNHNMKVDARVIAATNRDIEREMRDGLFRQDLLFRLNAVTLHLPPLRERREDILPLARHFAARLVPAGQPPLAFSREAVETLEAYDWPGNIRELENAVVRAAALCDEIIRPQDLPERVRARPALGAQPGARPEPNPEDERLLTLAEVEERHVARVLARMGGNKQAAARALGVDRTTLQRMLKRYDLEATGAAAPSPRGAEQTGDERD
jgi:DNA-binding NtrC family response regulator